MSSAAINVTDSDGFTLVSLASNLDEADGASSTAEVPTGEVPTPSSNVSLSLTQCDATTIAKFIPPQTSRQDTSPTQGAHCLVLDVSYSMDGEAKVINDSGDKVTHGWSQLDIVKHAACTYVRSLGPQDHVCIVTFADTARVHLNWQACTDEGKDTLDASLRALKTEGSTNLTAGIEVGMRAFGTLPAQVAAAPHEFAMNLVVLTDGQPTSSTHPRGGVTGYVAHVDALRREVEEAHGPRSLPALTAIAFGNSLDSALLQSFSDVFLHIPDPGSVGPFMVNLLAATRSTAKLNTGTDVVTANHARLILSPASSVHSVPGYDTVPWRNGTALAVELGSLVYDAPRHVAIKTLSADARVSASLEVSGVEVVSTGAVTTITPEQPEAAAFAKQVERTSVLNALRIASDAGPDSGHGLQELAESVTNAPLKATLDEQVLLALHADKWRAWGQHYVRTLGQMLMLERRSNFRDACLQAYAQDAKGKPGIFEAMSDAAELTFATLKPPEPSLLARRASTGASAPPRRTYTSMPDEFMRGGGCFGPSATVQVYEASTGTPVRMRVGDVRAGDLLVCPGGRLAPVRCVVLTECEGGRAQLTRLPNGGPEITEWHPVCDTATGTWHFPIVLGTQVIVRATHVYNFVLAPGHPAVLVDGVPCVTLGHGLDAPVAAHPYWGTRAVIDDLMAKPGWESGRVVMPAHAKSTMAPM